MKKIFSLSRFLVGSLVAFALFAALPAAYALADGPTITATDITAEAASSTGATVAFNNINATTTNASSTSFTVSCTPPSGNFALGTSTVTCVADDGITTSTATFNVSVVDRTPPSITAPVDQTFTATGTSTTPTLVKATSTDLVDPNPTISYSPISFSPSTTTVIWTATDASGNTATTTSKVSIINAPSVPINLEIEMATTTLYSGTISVSACADTENGTSTTINAMCAIEQVAQTNGFSVVWKWFAEKVVLVAAGGEGDWNNGPWWTVFSNLESADITLADYALNQHLLTSGEKLLLTTTIMPLKISASPISPVVGATTTIKVLGFDTNAYDFEPVAGAAISGVSASTTDANGNVDILATSTNPITISASANGFLPSQSITITPASVPPLVIIGGGGGGGISVTHYVIDIDKAIQFLSARQKPDGSFGAGLYTDWAAIALAAGASNSNRDKVAAYLKSAPNTGVNVTDYERRAMALMSLGINPYSGTDINYIQKITDNFDGTQIGEPSLVNDDIFAIFPLTKSGYSESDPIIQKVIAFILSKQRADGSWEGNVDMTAAAIQSLALFPSAPYVSPAQTKARDYLLRNQQNNGGFGGGSFSTSWAIQAIAALSESLSNWQKNNNTPGDYLYSFQQSDGGIEPLSVDESTRVWATAYAIPAALGKTWVTILSSFPRPAVLTGATAQTSASSVTGDSLILSVNETTSTASTTSVVVAATTTQASELAGTVANISSTTPASFPKSFPNVTARNDSRQPEIATTSSESVTPKTQSEIMTKNNEPVTPDRRQATTLATVVTSGVAEAIKHVGSIITGTVSFFIDVFLSAFRRL